MTVHPKQNEDFMPGQKLESFSLLCLRKLIHFSCLNSPVSTRLPPMEYKGALTASLGTYAFQLQDAFYINKKTSPCKAEPYLPLQGWM